jgi:hypothetical protein
LHFKDADEGELGVLFSLLPYPFPNWTNEKEKLLNEILTFFCEFQKYFHDAIDKDIYKPRYRKAFFGLNRMAESELLNWLFIFFKS